MGRWRGVPKSRKDRETAKAVYKRHDPKWFPCKLHEYSFSTMKCLFWFQRGAKCWTCSVERNGVCSMSLHAIRLIVFILFGFLFSSKFYILSHFHALHPSHFQTNKQTQWYAKIQILHSIECCRAHAACIATPSGNNVNTESPSTRLQTGQNVTAVFSNDELRKLIYSSLTSNLRTAANCLSISELRLFSSNFVITTSMLSINYRPLDSLRLHRSKERRPGEAAALPRCSHGYFESNSTKLTRNDRSTRRWRASNSRSAIKSRIRAETSS